MASKEKSVSPIVATVSIFLLVIIIGMKFILGNGIVYYLKDLFS